MITLTQNYIRNGEIEFTSIHIFSADGHFVKDDHNQGWHIQLGSEASAEDYVEISDGSSHIIPDSLPDIIIEDESEEATIDDYKQALRELGVDIPEEEVNEDAEE